MFTYLLYTLMCTRKLTNSKFNLPHRTKNRGKRQIKNDLLNRNGPGKCNTTEEQPIRQENIGKYKTLSWNGQRRVRIEIM